MEKQIYFYFLSLASRNKVNLVYIDSFDSTLSRFLAFGPLALWLYLAAKNGVN